MHLRSKGYQGHEVGVSVATIFIYVQKEVGKEKGMGGRRPVWNKQIFKINLVRVDTLPFPYSKA